MYTNGIKPSLNEIDADCRLYPSSAVEQWTHFFGRRKAHMEIFCDGSIVLHAGFDIAR
jgi:hypothetical protein